MRLTSLRLRSFVSLLALSLLAANSRPTSARAQTDAGSPSAPSSSTADATSDADHSPDAELTECVRSTVGILSVLEDAGPAERRREARRICADSGIEEVSSDDPLDALEDVDLPGDDTSTLDRYFAIFEVLFALAVVAASWWMIRRREKRFDAVMDEGDPAFDIELDIDRLRAEPELLDRIRGEVSEICIMRLPSSDGGGRYSGSDMTVSYAAFLVDAHGETHEFTRADAWDAVQADAEWLADQLDVGVRDEAYG